MKSSLQPYIRPVMHPVFLLQLAALLLPVLVRAECKEFKIVESQDRVEVTCVGEPLTEAQKNANRADERRQEIEAQRQRAEELRIQVQDAAKNKAQAEAEMAAGHKKQAIKPVTPQPPVNRNATTNPQILFK